jgi:hypothetical protein
VGERAKDHVSMRSFVWQKTRVVFRTCLPRSAAATAIECVVIRDIHRWVSARMTQHLTFMHRERDVCCVSDGLLLERLRRVTLPIPDEPQLFLELTVQVDLTCCCWWACRQQCVCVVRHWHICQQLRWFPHLPREPKACLDATSAKLDL